MSGNKYEFGVAWIALNDEPEETCISTIAAQISVLLLADMYVKEPEVVARDIYICRARMGCWDHER